MDPLLDPIYIDSHISSDQKSCGLAWFQVTKYLQWKLKAQRLLSAAG